MEAVIFWVILIILYWVPTIIAVYRKLTNRMQIGVLNFFAFLGIPWIVALVWAFKPANTEERPING